MKMEYTFAMLKPGVLQRRLAGEIIARIEKKGLQIHACKMMQVSEELARVHYKEHEGKPFFNDLVAYITSGPVIAFIIGGDDAVAVLRKLCGATRVEDALPGTIRGDFAEHTGKNIIHASDSIESAKREIALFFNEHDFIDWKDNNDEWI
ncbi:MAG TPA: nucleoside-diphosphate kinase [Spirochaetales bacterium]|nr:nucleoside-diphosphate kinase [Spirochaetales bacterium]HPD81383.1 nucleoside-diphosphate kinase [Spirochaetales bacterium]HRV29589.1 nucleoside-diphosphate kinase [Spirochaetia bacterium]